MAYSVTSATRTASPIVRVNGLTLSNVDAGSVNFSLESPVPTADVTIAGQLPSWIKRGDAVEITFENRLFTGTVKRRNRSPGQSTISCVGTTQILWRPFKTAPWTFSSVTAQAAVTTILDDIGLTDRLLEMVAWTIGVQKDAVLDLSTPGEAIQKIIDVDDHRMFELPSGALVVRGLLEVPAPTPFRTYTTTGSAPWVNDISDDEDEDQVKKKVYVSGAVLETTDAEGNVTQTQIQEEAFTTDNSLVAGDSELYSMNYQSDLIEDSTKGAAVALQKLDKHHRIVERTSLSVPLDPDIQLAMTIEVQDADVTGRSSRWFVTGYQHSWSKDTAETVMDLSGGDQSGTSGQVAPQPDFTWEAEREVFGAGERVIVHFKDNSHDADGTIADYHWSDNYAGGVNDDSGATLTEITYVYDPTIDASIDVTLEVTDDDGNARSLTRTVDVSPGSTSVNVPEVAAASKNTAMFTPDGGLTWYDQTGFAAGDLISVSAAAADTPTALSVLVFGTSTGRIYRNSDQLATAPSLVFTEPASSPINDLWWSTDPTRLDEVWACTQNGRLYRSTDAGVTWALYKDFGGTYPLNDIATPPDIVFVFGGKADLPATLIQYNFLVNPADWFSPDMSGFVAGAAAETVQNAGANDDTEFLLLFKGGRDPALVYTVDLWATPVVWQNGTGLTAGLTDGRAMTSNGGKRGSFLAFFGTIADAWSTEDGVAWTQKVGVLPGTAANRARHLFSMPGFQDAYIGGSVEGVFKTLDKATAVSFLRPVATISTWPAGADCYMVTFQVRAGAFLDPSVYAIFQDSADSAYKLLRLRQNAWSIVNAALTVNAKRLRKFGDTLFHTSTSNYRVWGSLERSADGGATFAAVLARCSCVAKGPDSKLWAVTHDATLNGLGFPIAWYVHTSTDDGVTWSVGTDITVYPAGVRPTPLTTVDVHPQDPAKVVVSGRVKLAGPDITYTVNGGGAWTQKTAGGSDSAGGEDHVWTIWGQNDRFVQACGLSPKEIRTLDSPWTGAWTTRYTPDATVVWDVYELVRCGSVGNWIYAVAEEVASNESLVRSDDNGETWEEVGSTTYSDCVGAAYHPDGERLFIVARPATPNLTEDAFKVSPTTALAADLAFAALTFNLASVLGATSDPQDQGVAV